MARTKVLVTLLLLLGVVGCDVGEPDEPPSDPSTVAIDPAPTTAESGGTLEYGDTGAQPDLLPGGGAPPFRYRLRVTDDGCTVERTGRRGGVEGLAWMLNSADGTLTDPRGDRTTFRPDRRGTGVVSLVVRDDTGVGSVVKQVSNTVRVRCR